MPLLGKLAESVMLGAGFAFFFAMLGNGVQEKNTYHARHRR